MYSSPGVAGRGAQIIYAGQRPPATQADPADYPANPDPAAARLLEASSAAAKAASGGDASG